MRSFPSSELKRTLGDVLDAASQEPVAITKHKTPRYVLMSIHAYESRFPNDKRQSFAVKDMPGEHLAKLETALAGLDEDGKA
ncbi:type II toxin-antitoxin system Phd/YefM family antitoxin [Paenirhodobacter sp.]|uniref:type II toxin-antitoxin system Phd/YefM family antitoxin n=1 Tax=Paenirhodobacter sp. TaxID=1965326 RepID=UPI003B40EEB1